MKLTDYYDELDSHDWHYDNSDNGQTWERGAKNWERLQQIAEESPEHLVLAKGFMDHHFSGKPWNSTQKPKPERPSKNESGP